MKKCYANVLGDCAGKLSREHYVSKGLIDLGQDKPSEIVLGGKLDIGTPASSKNLAVSKILCEHHNSLLSDLDAEAIRLATSILEWNSDGGDAEHIFNGEFLLRWKIKSLLGFVIAKKDCREIIESTSFEQLCKWAFAREDIPSHIGVSVPHAQITFPASAMREGKCPPWALSLLLDPFNRISGLQTWFYPLDLTLDFRGHPSMSQTQRFQPNQILFVSERREGRLTLNFTWNDWTGGTVTYPLD